MKDSQTNIHYRIDAADEIVAVSGDWDRFARENGAPPELLSDRILHRRFWDFVSGDTLGHIYARMLAKVRTGESLVFSFRCDSPERRRFLTLRMNPTNGDGGVEFLTETVCTEERESQPLFSTHAPKVGSFVVACSWCNKIKTSATVWREVEDAVVELGLFENDVVPPLSHGMCETCYAAAVGKLDDRQSPAA